MLAEHFAEVAPRRPVRAPEAVMDPDHFEWLAKEHIIDIAKIERERLARWCQTNVAGAVRQW
jgi:hypothetical protein